jgi:hypothetical protein
MKGLESLERNNLIARFRRRNNMIYFLNDSGPCVFPKNIDRLSIDVRKAEL